MGQPWPQPEHGSQIAAQVKLIQQTGLRMVEQAGRAFEQFLGNSQADGPSQPWSQPDQQPKTKRTKGQVITRKDQRRVPPARMVPVRRHSRARRPGH
jgi:hypothetical protein